MSRLGHQHELDKKNNHSIGSIVFSTLRCPRILFTLAIWFFLAHELHGSYWLRPTVIEDHDWMNGISGLKSVGFGCPNRSSHVERRGYVGKDPWPQWIQKQLSYPVTILGVSKNRWFSPQIIHFDRVFHYKPSILGYPYFWKHPYWVSNGRKLVAGLVVHRHWQWS